MHDVRFENTKEPHPIDGSSPAIVRDPNKCILCGDCVRMCDNVQGVNAIDFAYRGTEAIVSPAFNKPIAQTDCVNCDSAVLSVRPEQSVSRRILMLSGMRLLIRYHCNCPDCTGCTCGSR